MKSKTRIVRALGVALMAVAVTPWLGGGSALADNPSSDCPAGTTAVAKYEWTGGGYVAEFGGDVVTVTGTTTSGTFTSTVPISAVFVKGGTDGKTTLYNPAVLSGSFDNTGLVNNGGQTPAISHVTFCAGASSTTSTPVETTTTPVETTTTPVETTTTPVTTTTTPVTTTTTPATITATVTSTATTSVLPAATGTTPAEDETEEAAVEGTKTGTNSGGTDTGVLAATGSGLPVGLALAVSMGLLLGGAALLFVPGRLAVERGTRRRH